MTLIRTDDTDEERRKGESRMKTEGTDETDEEERKMNLMGML